MRARLLAVGLTALLGTGVASPAFASDGGSATVCDTLLTSTEPGGCVSVAEWTPRIAEYPLDQASFCSGDTQVFPTVTGYCVYAEVDTSIRVAAQP